MKTEIIFNENLSKNENFYKKIINKIIVDRNY